MKNIEERKCFIKSKEYGGTYLSGDASYVSGLINAKIFNYGEVPEYLKDNSDIEIILLDSEKGLGLLVREIEYLDGKIPQEEANLNRLKNGREKIFQANPEMLSKYIERHNKFNRSLMGVSENQKKSIINNIIEESQN